MRIFTSLSDVAADFGPSVVTIGKFDGVHEGHRAMVHRLRTTAAARGLASVVVTFDRNPLSLLRPEVCPEPLVSTEQKLDLLAATDPDATLVLTFDRSLAEETPEETTSTDDGDEPVLGLDAPAPAVHDTDEDDPKQS